MDESLFCGKDRDQNSRDMHSPLFLAGSACTVIGGFSCSFSFASSIVTRLRDWTTWGESDFTFPALCIGFSCAVT